MVQDNGKRLAMELQDIWTQGDFHIIVLFLTTSLPLPGVRRGFASVTFTYTPVNRPLSINSQSSFKLSVKSNQAITLVLALCLIVEIS